MAITNIWHRFNLIGSPFFQEPVADKGADSSYPADLFVGRTREAERLLAVIGGSGTSRQIVQGRLGVGKTTLVQYVKARVGTEGYLSDTVAVNVGHAESTDVLAARILDYVCRVLIANRAPDHDPALEEARRLVHVSLMENYSAGVSVGGFGVQGGRAAQTTVPASAYASVLIGEMLRRLMRLAQGRLSATGIVVHLNNLENLTDETADRAGRLLRDLRDPCLFADGYHWIVVGTTEAMRTAIGTHEQLRSVFSVSPPLAPLSAADVHHLLDRRYASMRRDATVPIVPPVTPETVDAIYDLFQGDLRGTLRAFDEGAGALLGFGTAGPMAPLGVDEMRRVLVRIYQEEMQARLSPRTVQYLARTAEHGVERILTQRLLRDEWDVAAGTVSQVLAKLQHHGYVADAGRATVSGPGRPEAQYVLTGTSHLVFNPPIVREHRAIAH